MKKFLPAFLVLITFNSTAQELFPYTEPASNMPAKSMSLKMNAMFGNGVHGDKIDQRYSPEVMFGLSKKWMLHAGLTFSNMYENFFYYESARVYAKYRFLSNDDVHKHFRMAAFATAAYSRNHLQHNELNLMGDHSGVQAGLIATQLWNKLAVSSTISYLQTIKNKNIEIDVFIPGKSFNYTVSAGYLVFPFNYTSFKQTNFNVYAELLGQRALDMKKYVVDFAPGIQFIFNSNAKLNIGYRYQISGNMYRMAEKSWLVSFERTFLGAWK